MSTQLLHEAVPVFGIHRDYYLFFRRSLGCHIEARFWFIFPWDNLLNVFDLLILQFWECLLDFKNLPGDIKKWGRSLSIHLFYFVFAQFFEVFRNSINLLRRFCWDQREKTQNQSWFGCYLTFLKGTSLHWQWVELYFNLLSEKKKLSLFMISLSYSAL